MVDSSKRKVELMAKDYSDRAVEAVMPVFGDTSERVKELQTALIARGFTEVGKADGIYGEATQKAISNFQNSIDLEVTGLAEPETFIELYKLPVKTQATSTSTEASLQPQSTTQTTLRKVEAGGYDTLYGNFERGSTPFKGVSVSNMTIGELTEFSRASGAYGKYVKPRLAKNTLAYKKGYTSTPMGKYQIVGSTLRDLTNRMNLPADTVFNKETQDKMFLFLARENLAKAKNPQAKRKNLRSIWEGFKHVDNSTLDKIIKEIDTNG
jgi:peptidoglycan hydrolase-like protein with peptidoglycan-binding domain